MDVATEQERLLADPRELLTDEVEALSPAERARRERMREVTAGVVGYSTDLAVTRAAFALVRAAVRRRPRRRGSAAPAAGAGAGRGPAAPPDGEHVAYVAGGALRVVAWRRQRRRRLAAPRPSA